MNRSLAETVTNTKPVLGTLSARPGSVARQILDLIERGKQNEVIPSAILLALFEQLEPVSIEFMLSTWHGSVFHGQPTQGWWGKNMISADHVQPMLFRREDGSVYSNDVWGMAKLTEGECYGMSKTVKLV
jgi:GXWXG protein